MRREHHIKPSLRKEYIEPIVRGDFDPRRRYQQPEEHLLPKVLGVGAAVAAGYVAYQMLPDLVRYMRIRSM